jgi:hypothetical protein
MTQAIDSALARLAAKGWAVEGRDGWIAEPFGRGHLQGAGSSKGGLGR